MSELSIDIVKKMAAIFGSLLMIFSALQILSKFFSLKPYYIKVKGVVLDIDNIRSDFLESETKVKFEFTTITNETIRGEIHDTTYPSLYKIGESIDVAYDENNHSDFVVLSRKQKIVYFLFLFIGVVIAAKALYDLTMEIQQSGQ